MTKSKLTTNKLTVAVSPRGIASLTLSRPEKGNALDAEMLEGISAALEHLSDDVQARVVVLRGEGRHFCTGADIAGIKIADEAETERVSIASICARLNSCPKPTIAVVHGGCLGGGLAIASCCDAVLAETGAFFAIPEVRLGFAPTALMPFFLAACGPDFCVAISSPASASMPSARRRSDWSARCAKHRISRPRWRISWNPSCSPVPLRCRLQRLACVARTRPRRNPRPAARL